MKYIYQENVSKNKYFKQIFVCILIFLCFIIGKTAYSQNCLDNIHRNPLYSNSKSIVNGTKWVYEKKYLGSPLLFENHWPKADILYKGVQYNGILINYDLYKNQVIMFDPEINKKKYVVLCMDYFSGFAFFDSITGRKHMYEYMELTGTRGKALYENATSTKIPFFIKPVKTIEARSANKDMGKYTGHFDNYIGTGNEYVIIRSKGQLIKVLAKHITEVKRYIRRNNLKINNQHPENIIAVLNYFDTLNE